MNDPYKILGITDTAGIEEIKSAWKSLAKINHPDINDNSEETMALINWAYTLLTDPDKLAIYNLGYTESSLKKAVTTEFNSYIIFVAEELMTNPIEQDFKELAITHIEETDIPKAEKNISIIEDKLMRLPVIDQRLSGVDDVIKIRINQLDRDLNKFKKMIEILKQVVVKFETIDYDSDLFYSNDNNDNSRRIGLLSGW